MTTQSRQPGEHGDTAQAVGRNLEDIAQLERESHAAISPGERIGIAVTNAAGTMQCALLHLTVFVSWFAWNAAGPSALRFDPYPFGLLTMIVSMEGVILAVLVLVTQNRLTQHTSRRDHLSLQVNLLAEQEMTLVLRMLARIAERVGAAADTTDEEEARRLMQRTNLYELMDELRKRLR
jgi:uncharacterized membrane protein